MRGGQEEEKKAGQAFEEVKVPSKDPELPDTSIGAVNFSVDELTNTWINNMQHNSDLFT